MYTHIAAVEGILKCVKTLEEIRLELTDIIHHLIQGIEAGTIDGLTLIAAQAIGVEHTGVKHPPHGRGHVEAPRSEHRNIAVHIAVAQIYIGGTAQLGVSGEHIYVLMIGHDVKLCAETEILAEHQRHTSARTVSHTHIGVGLTYFGKTVGVIIRNITATYERVYSHLDYL